MALIVSPKTTQKQVDQLSKLFNWKKVPKDKANLELSNFNDNFYYTKIGKVPVYLILTGYGGASVGFAIAQYEKNYKKYDSFPEAYFIGSILKARRAEHLHLADILYASDTYGEDEWCQSLYKVAKEREIKDITKPDGKLVKRISGIARKQKINLKSGKILCRWHPGILEKFDYVLDLLDEGMWWQFELSEGIYKNHDFDGGEIESAAFVATCKLAKIPCIALLDVRDERISKGDGKKHYLLTNPYEKAKAQENIIKLIQLSIKSLNH